MCKKEINKKPKPKHLFTDELEVRAVSKKAKSTVESIIKKPGIGEPAFVLQFHYGHISIGYHPETYLIKNEHGKNLYCTEQNKELQVNEFMFEEEYVFTNLEDAKIKAVQVSTESIISITKIDNNWPNKNYTEEEEDFE